MSILSPLSSVEVDLEIWREDSRGTEASDDELRNVVRFIFYDEPLTLSPERQLQVLFQWLDRLLPSPARNPGRLLESSGSSYTVADLEEYIGEKRLAFESRGYEKQALDLWIEGECLDVCIQTVSGMQGRWKDLRTTLVDEGLSEKTRTYLREAAQAFLLGQFKASVALCRASLEAALKECLPGVPPGSGMVLKELIGRAKSDRVLAGRYGRLANKIRSKGNRILHIREDASEVDARRILQHTSEIFEQLFKPS